MTRGSWLPRPSPYEHPSRSWLRRSKRREHTRYEKEKVAKINETEKNDRSSTNNEVIASAEVTELTEQVVTFNICAVKAAEKVAIGNADDVPAEQAVPGEPELKQTPIKQSKMMKQQYMLSRVTMKRFKTAILMKNFLQS